MSSGKTATAASPSQMSVTSSHTDERTSIRTTLVANGNGLSTWVAASASTPARVMRSPVRWRRCHGTGCATTRSTTSAVNDSVTRHDGASRRRYGGPPRQRHEQRRRRSADRGSPRPRSAGTDPSVNLGTMRSSMISRTTTEENTVHAANTAAKPTAMKNSRLWCRNSPRIRRNACFARPMSGGTIVASRGLSPFTWNGSIRTT